MIERIALSTKDRILPRFQNPGPEKLDIAGTVQDFTFGTRGRIFVIEEYDYSRAVTIFIRGS